VTYLNTADTGIVAASPSAAHVRQKKQTHASLCFNAVCRPEPFRLFIFKLSVGVPSQLIAATVTAPLDIFSRGSKLG